MKRNWLNALFFSMAFISCFELLGQDRFVNLSMGQSYPTGKKDILFESTIIDSVKTRSNLKNSMGAGTQFNINYHWQRDSSLFFYEIGVGGVLGYNVQTLGYTIGDDLLEYGKSRSNWLLSKLMVGFNIKEKNNSLYLKLGLVAPIYNYSKQRIYFYNDIGSHESIFTQKYKPSLGFSMEGGYKYKVWKNIHLNFGVNWLVLNQSLKSTSLTGFNSSDGTTKNLLYSSISEREVVYLTEIKQGINDPIINPNGFDKNKPRETIADPLPFSSFGIMLGVSFRI